jgi:predicted nucleic acid-binding protein
MDAPAGRVTRADWRWCAQADQRTNHRGTPGGVNRKEIIERAFGQSPAIMLRTLDAIHLAAAIVSGELEVFATDKRLREAAISLGLSVYPPP